MKIKTIILLSIIISINFTFIVNASGGTKTTTFPVKDYFSPTVCDLVVRFSWDSDSWEIGDKHTVSFSFEVQNINEEISDLSLSVKNIIVRLDSDEYHGAVDIVDEDISNQITSMVWRENYATFYTTPRSFSFEVEAPSPHDRLSEDSTTKLYYWVELMGSYAHDDIDMGNGVTLKAGSHDVENEWLCVSNEGNMVGGIEDPVWIILKAQPAEFPTLYIAVVACIAVIIGVSVVIVMRRKKRNVAEAN